MNTLSIFRSIFLIMSILAVQPLCADQGRRQARISHPPVFLASIPKAGTHMLKKCLGLMGCGDIGLTGSLIAPQANFAQGRRHGGLLSHAVYNEELAKALLDSGYKVILMIRDPRAQSASFIHFTHKNKTAWPALSSRSFDDALSLWITNTSHLQSTTWGRFNAPILQTFKGIDDFYAHYLQWMQCPNVCLIKFENLVGSKGGGSDELQRAEIRKIADHLEITLTDDRVQHVMDNLFGASRTFRSGTIDSWRTHFKPHHRELFKEVAGQLLIDLGYEKDLEWD